MHKVVRRLRRVATIFVAGGAMTAAVCVPSAHASTFYNDNYCGSNVAVDGVYTRGCFYEVQGESGQVIGYRVGTKQRIPNPLDPLKWTECSVNIRLYEQPRNSSSYRKIAEFGGDCVADFRANSQNNKAFRMVAYDYLYTPPAGALGYVQVRWSGKYNGQPVGMGSGPYANSPTVYGRYTLAALDNAVVESPVLPAAPGVLSAPDTDG